MSANAPMDKKIFNTKHLTALPFGRAADRLRGVKLPVHKSPFRLSGTFYV
jgi:hypothetical protein